MHDLERDAAYLGVASPGVVQQADLNLVVEVVDAGDLAGIADGCAALAEAPTVPLSTTAPSVAETATSSGAGRRGSCDSSPRI